MAARGCWVTLGLVERQGDLLDPVIAFCDGQIADDSIYGLLHRERDRLFPDEMFVDLYTDRGRRSVPPSILACVLVLQRLEGLSDREAADRFTYDARWRYACGVGGWEAGPISFVHTVLVRFRMRLEGSDDPRRIFKVTTRVAAEAGLVGVKRVLDSAPLFDAVATMDTVTLIRSAIRGLLSAADPKLGKQLRALLSGIDDYAGADKPACDWDDPDARSALIDGLARDGLVLLAALEGRQLSGKVAEAAQLVALVIGQDLELLGNGTWRIARKVAREAKGKTFKAIDWAKTKAFASPIPQQGVFVNLEGRERLGIVPRGELAAVARVRGTPGVPRERGLPARGDPHPADRDGRGPQLPAGAPGVPPPRDHRRAGRTGGALHVASQPEGCGAGVAACHTLAVHPLGARARARLPAGSESQSAVVIESKRHNAASHHTDEAGRGALAGPLQEALDLGGVLGRLGGHRTGLFGSGGGRLQTGMHIRAAGDPCCRVGLTVQQAMGVPISTWGDRSNQTTKTVTEIMGNV